MILLHYIHTVHLISAFIILNCTYTFYKNTAAKKSSYVSVYKRDQDKHEQLS